MRMNRKNADFLEPAPAAVLLCSGTIECYYILMTQKVNKYWNVFITKSSFLQMPSFIVLKLKTLKVQYC